MNGNHVSGSCCSKHPEGEALGTGIGHISPSRSPANIERPNRWLLPRLIALLVGFGLTPGVVDGQTPASTIKPASTINPMTTTVPSAATDDAAGFVLLRNGNVIQGSAKLLGTTVVIDRGDGSELRLDRRQVSCVASSLDEVYRYRTANRPFPDVKSFNDDARWCLQNRLYDEMAVALDAAAMLDPSHPETLRLRRSLDAITGKSDKGRGGLVMADAFPDRDQGRASEREDDGIDDSQWPSGALAHFANPIQPLLINRCGNAGCHRSPTDANWQLSHLGIGVRTPARLTRLNLAATLGQIESSSPQTSPLLRYATMAHAGRGDAPLKRGDESAIESLRDWVTQVADWESGHDSDVAAKIPAPSQPPARSRPVRGDMIDRQIESEPAVRQAGFVDQPRESSGGFGPDRGNWPVADVVPAAGTSRERTTTRGGDRMKPQRLPKVENPFDPAIFNRVYR